eukprot:1422787-Pyramimonas_sp.AAC.1
MGSKATASSTTAWAVGSNADAPAAHVLLKQLTTTESSSESAHALIFGGALRLAPEIAQKLCIALLDVDRALVAEQGDDLARGTAQGACRGTP